MWLIRAVAITAVTAAIGALLGGATGLFLRWLTPDYFVAAFGVSVDRMTLVSAGTGAAQGLGAGVAIGVAVSLVATLLGSTARHALRRTLPIVLCLSVAGAIVVAAGGAAYGALNPDYYLGLLSPTRRVGISPRQFAVGLGTTQGLGVGAAIGAIIAIVRLWYRPWNDPTLTATEAPRRSHPVRFVALMIIIVVAATPIGLYAAAVLWNDEGSMDLARLYARDLANFDPIATSQPPSEIEFCRLPSGEWAAVRCRDSHSLPFTGGGTVVVRDSLGNARAFRGHVCGRSVISLFADGAASLSEFYENVHRHGFRAMDGLDLEPR